MNAMSASLRTPAGLPGTAVSSSCKLVILLATLLWLVGCSTHIAAPVREQAVSAPPPASSTPQDGAGYYTVRRGDTLNAIARQFGQTVANLAAWNNLNNVNQIEVGQVLRVAPPDGSSGRPLAADGGVEVRPIAPPGGESRPVAPPTTVVTAPKGGKQPYAEQPAAESAPPARVVEPAPESAASSSIKWIWPSNGRLIAQFAEGGNKGIDLAGNLGDPVIAASAGKVVYAGSGLRGYGKLVIIKHDNEFLSAYAHNRELLVKEGDTVASGQKIAELGNTDADRPKLHFEIRRQGKPVDPLKYLPSR